MRDFLIGMGASAVVGMVLWALLPRGVVLTRAMRTQNWRGETLYDTWQLKNNSSLPIRLTSVTVTSPSTYNASRNRVEGVPLTPQNQDGFGISLRFDDDITELTREDIDKPWNRVIIPPGDTLQASVPNNTNLRIKYRRAGVMGVLERRNMRVQGNV
jgi:hypothetical protein